jgi:hypothetical protein
MLKMASNWRVLKLMTVGVEAKGNLRGTLNVGRCWRRQIIGLNLQHHSEVWRSLKSH